MSRIVLMNEFDLTPSGKIVDCAQLGEEGYGENVRYEISSHEDYNGISYHWYGEDGEEMPLEEYVRIITLQNQ